MNAVLSGSYQVELSTDLAVNPAKNKRILQTRIEDGPQVADVRGGQVQGGAEVFDGLGLWNERSL